MENQQDKNTIPKATEEEPKEYQQIACLPYFGKDGSYKLKRILNRAGVKTIFKSDTNLKNILCAKNKTKQPEKSAIYKIDCTCSTVPHPSYIGQTIRQVKTRVGEHKVTAEKGYTGREREYTREEIKKGWGKSGIVQHKKTCKEPTDWENFKVLAKIRNSGRNRARVQQELQIREALEIRYHQTGPRQGLNLDQGNLLNTNAWEPLLTHMRK